ncbi:malto-oligosyltrehalose trehalohydrolase [Streptomyces lonarensis]|uniref:Malto-oligosyltrehalose trehalohydrolase n=1 Tax=Streptomyces lonarensis TaxID=700599 RepID=A0A7X6HZL8_9ACTN|nr:malto-oligosyltrehalose trehalohydrolase [Streptomyces lonarensis]NJQ06630.1 malto-oligosyltrehalose trehalohydrolase [Streptomyces lonarensis]
MLFEVWAPHAREVALQLDDATQTMVPDPARPGWWRTTAEAATGARYGFRLDGGPVRPDPRARRLPDGPGGPAAVVDPTAHRWEHPWTGRGLPGAVLYELHVGTFTGAGTLDAAAERLPDLAELGVSHVQLMPLSPFPGRHGWGYDGVAPWAVHEPYGGPAALCRFVDAAHGAGLGVVLDVVHNHLGPSGNFLSEFGPYFTDRTRTPWGEAVNLDGPGSDEVRAYFAGSALALLREYRLDGLRLDAVHALSDTRARHFLSELSASVDALAQATGRPLFLIAESDLNDPRTTAPRAAHGHGVHAQWNDDFHHCLHAALTGEAQGYYADFARAPLTALAATCTRGFFHDGGYSAFRERHHGAPLRRELPTARLVGYAQTHDQIGNRALGDRLAAGVDRSLLFCAAALVLCGPFTPMLFMGEEWGADTPWQYFTDHPDPELAAAVREGRRREFAAHGWEPGEVPDPQDEATRDRSVLRWPPRPGDDELRQWHRTLIALRAAYLPTTLTLGEVSAEADEGRRLLVVRSGPLAVAVNLSETAATAPLPPGRHEVLAARPGDGVAREAAGVRLPGRSVAVLRLTADGD